MWTTIRNPKPGASTELFLPENDLKTSSTVNFPKNVKILETWKQTKDMNLRLDFFFTCSYTYELNKIYKNWFGHLIGTYSKCHKYLGQN